MSSNPLLSHEATKTLPNYAQIRVHHIQEAVDHITQDIQQQLDALRQLTDPTWENLLIPLEHMEDRLWQLWRPLKHLSAVCYDKEWKAAYEQVLPLLTTTEETLYQDPILYQLLQQLSDTHPSLTNTQRSILTTRLTHSQQTGATIPEAARQKTQACREAILASKHLFHENLLNSLDQDALYGADPHELNGLASFHIQHASQEATRHPIVTSFPPAWRLTFETSQYNEVMAYAHSRRLRRAMYQTFAQAATTPPHNNHDVITGILGHRHQIAQLAGHPHYAAYVHQDQPERVDELDAFLKQEITRLLPIAQNHLATLQAFADQHGGPVSLAPWDRPYWMEAYKQTLTNHTHQTATWTFPLRNVLTTLFELTHRWIGLQILPGPTDIHRTLWHPTVQYHEVYDTQNNTPTAGLLLDLFARPNKEGGAWTDICQSYQALSSPARMPIAHVVCSVYADPSASDAYLSYAQLKTLFHEWGHALQHILHRAMVPSLSGLEGIPSSQLEQPAYLLEQWTRQPAILHSCSDPTQTAAREYALDALLRVEEMEHCFHLLDQLRRARVDLAIHREYQPALPTAILQRAKQIASEYPLFAEYEEPIALASFHPIFSGRYACTYYSYILAETQAATQFSKWKDAPPHEARQAFLPRHHPQPIAHSSPPRT
jgi:oligopeptidase A